MGKTNSNDVPAKVALTAGPVICELGYAEIHKPVLQALGLRSFRPQVTSSPGCGRTTSGRFRELAQEVQAHLDARTGDWADRYPGFENLRVAVMGCVVNGPGESRAAHVGISLPGAAEEPRAPVYVDGKRVTFLEGPSITSGFVRIIDEYVARRWGA